jgi:hypothetical protein
MGVCRSSIDSRTDCGLFSASPESSGVGSSSLSSGQVDIGECDEAVLPSRGVMNDFVLVPSLVTGRSFCLSAFFASTEVASVAAFAVGGREMAD